MLEVPVCRLILLSLLLLVISCNKLSTTAESNPINFSGIVSIQNSSDSSVILSWKIPFTVQIENYEIYILPLKAEDLDSLEESPVQKPETKDAASASTAQVQDIAKTVYPPASLLPSSQGKLVSLLSADRNSYRTATLEAGYYLFQVRALSTDGQRDANAAAKLVKIEDNKIFKGMQIAEVIGTDVHLQWLPYPDIRTTDTYQYVIYKGPAFNEKIAFTHDNHYTYSLLKESAGDTLYFGVRFADNKNIEDTNSTLIPLTVPVINKNYLGCLKAEAVGADRIKVTFEWPSENYKGMKIYRDQQEAFVGLDRDVTSFVDRGLVEGETYTYTCQGVTGKDIIAGSNKIKAATLSSNPPNFRGITNALSDSPTTVKISWGVSTGVPAQEFRIYANAGSSVNWAAEPVLKVGPSVLQAQLSKLGDDLPYAFGVRACGVSVCDPNTEQLVITTPDSGAPRSIGAQSALISNGTILITAPWKAEDGGISKRKIYVKMDGDPTPEISLYSLAQTVLVNDPIHPATQLSVGNLVSNKTYHLIVRDEDSHGNISSNTQVVSVTMGDLRPPDFNGISAGGLSVGAAGMEETSLTATFAAIQNSQQHPRGASSYRFYVREGSGPSCAEDYYKFSLDALGIAEGSTSRTIPNLKAKTIYSVCIKAVDKNGNLSINTNYLSRSTLDRTQPDFDGLQSLSFDASKGLINLAWNASASADISSYRIDTWLTLKNSSETIPITINRSASESPNSYSFDNSVVPFASEATLEVVVNACDNADSISGGSKNCSSFVRSQALKMTFADIEAPPGFMGIAAGPILTANEEGKVIVRWIDPSSWTDYAGFQVFTVDTKNELTLVKDCPCTSNPGCSDHLNSCTVTGLSDYRTYRFHVRAYDIAKN
ncbi:MAG: hypothetical protein NTX25_20500, partial [Proteobacteria bacterium]|nr:hypothetical protein [Pseudomonadota bacterium]